MTKRILVLFIVLVCSVAVAQVDVKVFRDKNINLGALPMDAIASTLAPNKFNGVPNAQQKDDYRNGIIKILRFTVTSPPSLTNSCVDWTGCATAVDTICNEIVSEPTLTKIDVDTDGVSILECSGSCDDNSSVRFLCP